MGVLVGFGLGTDVGAAVGVGVFIGTEPIIKYGLVPVWLIFQKRPQKWEGEK